MCSFHRATIRGARPNSSWCLARPKVVPKFRDQSFPLSIGWCAREVDDSRETPTGSPNDRRTGASFPRASISLGGGGDTRRLDACFGPDALELLEGHAA